MGYHERADGSWYGTQPRSRGPNLPDPMRRTSLLDTSHATLANFPSVMGIISGPHRTGHFAPQLLGQTVIGDFLQRIGAPSPPTPPTISRGSHLPADVLPLRSTRRLSSISGTGQEVAIDRGGMIGTPRTERMASVDLYGQGLLDNLLRSFEMVRTNMMRRFGL